MCQCQLSSVELPSGAAMPPCAATVCERVGNTLDNTATFSPAWESCKAARIPAPPAPTTTTSNVRFVTDISKAPQNLYRPNRIHQQSQHNRDMYQQTDACQLDVVHHDVAH